MRIFVIPADKELDLTELLPKSKENMEWIPASQLRIHKQV